MVEVTQMFLPCTELLHTPLLGYLPQSCSWVDIFVLILTCYALMLAGRVHAKQQKQKVGHDQIARQRQFHVGDNVFIRNFSSGPKWLPGSILEERGPCSFIIELEDGHNVRWHIDHIRIRTVTVTTSPDVAFDDLPIPTPAPSPDDQANNRAVVPRCSSRIRHAPERLM